MTKAAETKMENFREFLEFLETSKMVKTPGQLDDIHTKYCEHQAVREGQKGSKYGQQNMEFFSTMGTRGRTRSATDLKVLKSLAKGRGKRGPRGTPCAEKVNRSRYHSGRRY